MAADEGGTGQNLTSRTQARDPTLKGLHSFVRAGLNLPTLVPDLPPAGVHWNLSGTTWELGPFELQGDYCLPLINGSPSSDSIGKGRRRVLVFSSQNPLLASHKLCSYLPTGFTVRTDKGRGVESGL